MPSKKPVIAVRTTEEIKAKLEYIAEFNSRSSGKEIEMLIKEHIKQFEKYNGEIKIEPTQQEKYPLKLPYSNKKNTKNE